MTADPLAGPFRPEHRGMEVEIHDDETQLVAMSLGTIRSRAGEGAP